IGTGGGSRWFAMVAALCAVRQRSERPALDLEKLSGGAAHWLSCSTTTAAAGPGLLDLLLATFLRSIFYSRPFSGRSAAFPPFFLFFASAASRSAAPVGDCYSSPASQLAAAAAALLLLSPIGCCFSSLWSATATLLRCRDWQQQRL
ncbi:hypothetical protein HAX54_001283, partial [Datura stramonium]|nr:hypothetical protein [Datura stramonium]